MPLWCIFAVCDPAAHTMLPCSHLRERNLAIKHDALRTQSSTIDIQTPIAPRPKITPRT